MCDLGQYTKAGTDARGQHFARHGDMPAALHAKLEALAYDFGQTYDSYLVTEDNLEWFWTRDYAAAVGFVRLSRHAYVIGGPIADEPAKDDLIRQFLAFAAEERFRVVTFCNVLRNDADRLRAAGFQVTKCGEEPVVDLAKTEWAGGEYEWARRQENLCLRKGLTVREVIPGGTGEASLEAVATELSEISAEHIAASAHGRELRYLVGRFKPYDMKRRRTFIAQGESRIEGFIVCNPACRGTFWAVEMYRRRRDATRGVVPFTIMQAMRLLRKEGVSHVSLSLAPCAGCEQPIPGDSPIIRRRRVFWWRHLNWIFDVRGLYHFKSRFRPEFRDMFYASYPRATLRSARLAIRLWGIASVGPLRLIRNGLRALVRRSQRGTLAEP